MLAQNLVQNSVITTVENNTFSINWSKAAELVNLNFYITEKSVDETEFYRYNQYPYTQVENPPTDPNISVADLKTAMLTWPLHTVYTVSVEMANAYNELFKTEATTGQEAIQILPSTDIVRINDKYNSTKPETFFQDFFTIVPTITKYFFSPNGWYVELATQLTDTRIRQPLWGLRQLVQLNLADFQEAGSPLTTQTRELVLFPTRTSDQSITDPTMNDLQYQINEYSDPFYFAYEDASTFPLTTQTHFDLVWGRVVSGDLVINVPVTIGRSLNAPRRCYQYKITIPYNIPTTGYLELY